MSLRIARVLFSGLAILASYFSFAQSVNNGIGVIVQSVTEQALERRIEALGSLRANESIRVTSNVTKTVTRINFDDGQRVQKGHILVEMTSAEEKALLDEARIHTEEAKKQLDRVKQLVVSKAASQSLLDQQNREYESAKARDLAIESRLQDLRLTAPFDGVVGLRNVSVGALVSPGDLITTLNDDSKMKLDFAIPAIYMNSLRVGLPIVAQGRALGNKAFNGEIFSIDNNVDTVTRAITVRALIPNPRRELKQGMLMSVELFTDKRQALVMPESALVPLGSTNFVFVVNEKDGKTTVERRQINIGQRLEGQVEVLSGVSENEKVVTHGLQKIRDGSVVHITAEDSGNEKLSELIDAPKT